IEGRQFVRLQPGGWLAVQLAIAAVGKPYIIEVEYRHEGPMRLGMSIIQPDANQQIPSIGMDTGVVVPRTPLALTESDTGPQKHRFVFWSEHKNPMLLLANHDESQAAMIGRVRVLAGPSYLAFPEMQHRNQDDRQYLAYLERPFFAQQFDATRWLDEVSGQWLEDWQTFEAGANRLVQFLKANGYTGMAITVSCDGGTIYPSERLQATPRFDQGAFWSTGQDVMRKDILEMLLRICDRENLDVIPVIEFSGMLPEIEAIVHGDPQNTAGIHLVDQNGQPVSLTGWSTAYNTLEPRVQTAMLRVIDELLQRYQRHASFKSLGLKLTPDSLLPLNNPQWGMDAETLARFAAEMQLELNGSGTSPSTQDFSHLSNDALQKLRKRIMEEHGREWMFYRANRLSQFFEETQQLISQRLPKGKLYLLPVELDQADPVRSITNPTPRKQLNLDQAMLRLGIDIEVIQRNEKIEMLQTRQLAFNHELSSRRFSIHASSSPPAHAYFSAAGGGQLFLHRYHWTHFEQLQQTNPFGQQKLDLNRLQLLSPSGVWNRQRFAHSLFNQDCKLILDGGWLLPSGQNSAIGRFIDGFTRLPAASFQDVTRLDESAIHRGAAVRYAKADGQYYFYAVNPNPWPVECQVHVNRPSPIVPLVEHETELQVDASMVMTLQLEPYDLIAAKVDDTDFELLRYAVRIEPETLDLLRRQLDGLQAKVSRSSQPTPWQVLEDASFEEASGNSFESEHWVFDSQSKDSVQFSHVSDAKSGSRCLTLRAVNQPAYIRSKELPVPATGRLSISAWIRCLDGNKQPPLQVCIDGYYRGRSFYRFAKVSEIQKESTDAANWRQVVVHFEDIPNESLSQFRIGFDLMGVGHVQIDEVQLYDRWFSEQDVAALTQQYALASYRLRNEGDVVACRELLEQYWSFFFTEYFPDPPRNRVPASNNEVQLDADNRPVNRTSNQPIIEQIKTAPQRIFQRR
ncbi:MAG TPA: hypothetical protein PKA83_07180, partial [Pirellulaceae bacterium]|nr:hypothetical protein [Pirellulaceae bacterium]